MLAMSDNPNHDGYSKFLAFTYVIQLFHVSTGFIGTHLSFKASQGSSSLAWHLWHVKKHSEVCNKGKQEIDI